MSKPLLSAIFVCLMLPGIAVAQDQAGQDAGSCRAAMDAAEKLRKSEDSEELKKSLSLYQEALGCLGPAPTQHKADVMVKVSRLLLELNRHDEALDSLNSALEALQQLGDQNTDVLQDEAKVLGNLGYDYRILGKMDQALSYFEHALHLFERLHDL